MALLQLVAQYQQKNEVEFLPTSALVFTDGVIRDETFEKQQGTANF